MNHFIKRSIIHPEDYSDLLYWTEKWGVSIQQINHAIVETGSVKPKDIKNNLTRKGELGKLSFWISHFFNSWR
jgi:hypothetical protein